MMFIYGGTLITMAGKEYKKGYVVIKGSKILDAGRCNDNIISEYEKRNDMKMIDAKGGYILPGYIDAHCHVGMFEDAVGIEGEDGNEMTNPVTPQLRAIDGIYHVDRAFIEAREAGVTTVVTGPGSANVVGGQFAALKTCGRRIEDMILKEPCALKLAFGENPKRVYNNKGKTPSTRMATAAILRQTLYKAAEYKEKLEKYKKNPEKEKKPDYDLGMEILVKALNGELVVKAHVHRQDDILTAIRIAKEFNLKMTLDHCTEGHLIADIIKEEGFTAITGPFLSTRSKIELKNLSAKCPGILSGAGVNTAIMTDCPVIPIQYLPLCAQIAVKEGMDEKEALKAITINAAKAAGIDDKVGSIEKGKDADIVVLSGHPFDYRTKVIVTVINGEAVYEENSCS